MARKLKIGDSFTVGPFNAVLDDGSVIASITSARADLKLITGGAAVVTKTLGAGITLVDAATGEMTVAFDTADTAALVNGSEYVVETRVRTGGGKIYTVSRAEFEAETAMTSVPT